MARYTCLDNTLKSLEWLENYREQSVPAAADQIETLRVYLQFLKTFLLSASKLSAEEDHLKDLLDSVEKGIQNAAKNLQLLYTDEEDESTAGEKKDPMSDWVQEIKKLTPTIRKCYVSVLESDAAVTDIGCLVKLVNSLLKNLKDLLDTNTDLINSSKKQIENLQVKFRFLANFVWFSSKECIKHQKLPDLLRLIEAVANTASCLSFQCFFKYEKNEIIEKKFSEVLWTIKLIEPVLRDAYISSLKGSESLRLESSSPSGNELALGFLHSFTNDLEELLSRKSTFKSSEEDRLRTLQEELKFLLAFLMDPPKQDEENKINDLLAHIGAVARQTSPVIHMLLVSITDQDAAGELDLYLLFDLLNKINHIKEGMKKANLHLLKSMSSNLPMLNASNLIDFVLGTLNEVLNYKTRSIVFVGHQLDIVKAELVCLKSLLWFSTYLEEEATNVVHEAKHAIGSLIVREIPIWQCMLQLFQVIKHIRSFNGKLAAISVGENVENNSGAQNSDTLSSIAPEEYEMEVSGKDKEAEITQLKNMVTNGSKRLNVISVFITSKENDTVVKQVCSDSKIVSHFGVHATIYVHEKYERRDLLMGIFIRIANNAADSMDNLSETDLENMVYNHLQKDNYLIVLNDTWDTGAWNDISSCFPNNNCGSRVLLIRLSTT